MKRLREQWGLNIKEAREELGKSQRWLAQQVDVSPSNVNRWEKGLTAPRDIHKIAISRALDTPVRLLFPMNGDVV